jgi:hypothetical protein
MSTPCHSEQLENAIPSLPAKKSVTLNQMLALQPENALPNLLILISIPGLLPSMGVPFGSVFSLGMFALGAAWIAGARTLALPRKLGNFSFSHGTAVRILRATVKAYKLAETLCVSRHPHLTGRSGRRVIGCAVLINAFIIFLPIPFGNTIPALANIVLGLAVVFRDAWALAVGAALTLAGVGVAVAFAAGSLWVLNTIF